MRLSALQMSGVGRADGFCPADERRAAAAQGVCCSRAGCDGVLVAPATGADPAGAAAGAGLSAAAAHGDWRCTECAATRAAHTAAGDGCADVVARAGEGWQICMALMQARVRQSPRSPPRLKQPELSRALSCQLLHAQCICGPQPIGRSGRSHRQVSLVTKY